MGVQDPSDVLRQDTVDAILSHFCGPSNPVLPESQGKPKRLRRLALGRATAFGPTEIRKVGLAYYFARNSSFLGVRKLACA